jgi:hypothetical protein
VKQLSKNVNSLVYGFRSQAGIALIRFDQERAHSLGRFDLHFELTPGPFEKPNSIIIYARVRHVESSNLHSGTKGPNRLDDLIDIAHALAMTPVIPQKAAEHRSAA